MHGQDLTNCLCQIKLFETLRIQNNCTRKFFNDVILGEFVQNPIWSLYSTWPARNECSRHGRLSSQGSWANGWFQEHEKEATQKFNDNLHIWINRIHCLPFIQVLAMLNACKWPQGLLFPWLTKGLLDCKAHLGTFIIDEIKSKNGLKILSSTNGSNRFLLGWK